jgi:hypothetical protein
MDKRHVHSELVEQDVLLLAGEKDAFQPVIQMRALTVSGSVTDRIFIAAEQAQQHCGFGNISLVLDVMRE